MKWNRVLFAIVFIVLCFVFPCAFAEEDVSQRSLLVMPSSLRIIEDNAFENTMPEAIILSESVEYIGDRAFAGLTSVKFAYIPSKTVFIGESVFAGRDGIMIVGIPGSYAEEWAKRHRYRFVSIEALIEILKDRNSLKQPYTRAYKCDSFIPDGMEGAKVLHRLYFEKCFTDPKTRPEYYPIEIDFP